ncbi:MAG TPA: hypothetical protein DCQ92_17720 [Verrucomicrobia subdivision 3 bacterium]|nr:hypothetical protein [Limisphaerales bacterium]
MESWLCFSVYYACFHSFLPVTAAKSGGEPRAVHTLRAIWRRALIAKRLDCGCFSPAFSSRVLLLPILSFLF